MTIIVNAGDNTTEAARQAAIAKASAASADADAAAAAVAAAAAQNMFNLILGLVASNVYLTKAAATAALATIAANALVLVVVDESQANKRTIYKKVGGVLVYQFDLNTIDSLRAPGTPRLGRGVPIGAPIGSIVATVQSAGPLTGTFQYAYAESDGVGLSSLSQITSITVTGKSVRLTIPMPRRGTSQRFIYRTTAGGNTFKLLKALDGGSQYFQSVFVDNLADGSLGADHDGTDTTELWAVELEESVKSFRTHPDQGNGPADLTVLTGDSGYTAGAYAMDVYGEILTRTRLGNAFASEKAGESGNHFVAYYLGPQVDVDAPVQVFAVTPRGSLDLTRAGSLSDPAAEDGNSAVLAITGTHGEANTVSAAALDVTATGAGSAAFDQIGARFSVVGGYTGTAQTVGSRGANASGNAGEAIGAEGRATGAAAISVGVKGVVTKGTKQAGVVGLLEDVALSSLVWPSGVNFAAGLFSNGDTVGDILQGYDETTVVFRVANGGAVETSNVGANQTFDIFGSGGGGKLRLETNGGNYVAVGSTNNVDLRLRANGVDVASVTVRRTLNLPDRAADPVSPQDGDIWRNGNDLKVRLNGATRTIPVV